LWGESEIADLAFLPVIYAIVNGIAFLTFLFDKMNARRNRWRLRETALLGLAFLGPFGALGGMLFFRHKTLKLKFLLVPVFALVHGIILMIFLPGFL
jgi:uncharacterized membrane protein YsdA (DUF1294 family)